MVTLEFRGVNMPIISAMSPWRACPLVVVGFMAGFMAALRMLALTESVCNFISVDGGLTLFLRDFTSYHTGNYIYLRAPAVFSSDAISCTHCSYQISWFNWNQLISD